MSSRVISPDAPRAPPARPRGEGCAGPLPLAEGGPAPPLPPLPEGAPVRRVLPGEAPELAPAAARGARATRDTSAEAPAAEGGARRGVLTGSCSMLLAPLRWRRPRRARSGCRCAAEGAGEVRGVASAPAPQQQHMHSSRAAARCAGSHLPIIKTEPSNPDRYALKPRRLTVKGTGT